jgi:hypothetical protein
MSDTSLQRAAFIVAYVTFAVGLLTVFLRIYCRLHVLKSWGWDDYVAVFVGVSIAGLLCRNATANRCTKAVSCGQQVVLHLFLHWGCGLLVSYRAGCVYYL